MKKIIITLLGLALSHLAFAQEIKFSRDDLQQTIESYMPYSQQQSIFQLTVSQPNLSLDSAEQRVQIRTHIQVGIAIGGEGQGWVTLDGKLRYRSSNYSFYVDDLRVINLDVEGLSPEFKPHVQRFVQELISPLLEEQPVYTLQDNNVQESLAKMMLRSINIRDNHVVAKLSMF